jgi:hypothetical protein
MIHRKAMVCIDRKHELTAQGDDFRTRFILGAIQIGLAIVFVPCAVLIAMLVGLYMIAEWTILHVGGMTRRLGRHSTVNPLHCVRGFRRNTTIR